MKTLIMGFAAFTLALTSCQKQDLLDHIDDGSDGQMQFAVYQGTATKAAELMNSSLQAASETTPIPLYAYTGAQSNVKALYFEEALTWNSPTTGKWNTGYPRFLPQTGVLQFYTYYPTDGVVYAPNLGANTNPTLTYTVKNNETNPASVQDDLVAAALNDHASTKIVIPMRHILSQINFGVKGYYGAKIEIKDIKICQVNSSGTFTLNNTDETTWVWSGQATPADYPYAFSAFTTPGVDATNESNYTYFFGDGGNCGPGYGLANGANKWYVGNDGTAVDATTITTPANFTNNPKNSLMLLPQNLATGMSAAYVTFNYRISDLGTPAAWIVGSASSYVAGKFDLHFTTGTGANEYDKKWDPNYRYVYIIDFTNFLDGQKLTFDVDVQLNPWENYNSGGDNDGLIYISSLGEPIFEAHIKGLTNGGSYTLPAGNVFSTNSWDWSKYIMTSSFTAGDTFTVNFSNITFNGNSITVVPPVGFSVSDGGVADATNTTLTFTATNP